MGDLRQHARAVAALAVGRDRAAMRVVGQRGKRHFEDRMTPGAVLLRDKSHAARIALVMSLVERVIHDGFSPDAAGWKPAADNAKPAKAG
jgi:hypothetical protein